MPHKKSLILFTTASCLQVARGLFCELFEATTYVLTDSLVNLARAVLTVDTNLVIYGQGDEVYLDFAAKAGVAAGFNVIYIWTGVDPRISGVTCLQRNVGKLDDLPIKWVKEIIPLLKPIS